MSAPLTARPDRPTRAWIVFVATLAGLITAIASIGFVLSFNAEISLVESAGVSADLSWGWPLAVDGLAVVATAVFMAFRSRSRGIARYALGLLTAASLVAVLANAGHAVGIELTEVGLIAVGVMPPLAVLGSVHLLGLVIGVLWAAHADAKAAVEAAETAARRAEERALKVVAGEPVARPRTAPKRPTTSKLGSGSLYDAAVTAIIRLTSELGRMPSTSEVAVAAAISPKSAQRHRNAYLASIDTTGEVVG